MELIKNCTGVDLLPECDEEMRDISSPYFDTQSKVGDNSTLRMIRSVKTTTRGTQTDICGEIVAKGTFSKAEKCSQIY